MEHRAYFQTFSHMPMPTGHAPPPHDLAYYKAIYLPYSPGTGSHNKPKDPVE
jgi:alpha-glucuronidase